MREFILGMLITIGLTGVAFAGREIDPNVMSASELTRRVLSLESFKDTATWLIISTLVSSVCALALLIITKISDALSHKGRRTAK